jgi:putative hemolysin
VELAIAGVCVLMSALFSGTEVALFALRRVDREQMARSQRGADKRVLAILQQPRRLIATVLIANEGINAVLTVMVLQVMAMQLASPWVVGGVTVAAMIPIVVLVGEVTPKTLALKAPLAWARATAGPLALFTALVAPVRWLIGGFVEIVLRPFGAAPRPGNRDLSEEEFRILIDASSAQGQVDARERRLIHKVFEFSDKNVGQIMTPRDRVFALSYDLPTARLLKEVAARGFSRVPIYQKSLDNVRGILNAKDLLRPSVGQVGRTLGELLHEPLFVPRTTPIKRVFLTFKQRKVHMAIVVNEYGKVLGLVTMDDVLAQLFGTLRDEREGLQAAGRRGRPSVGRTPAAGVEADSGGSSSDGVPDERDGEREDRNGDRDGDFGSGTGEHTGPLAAGEDVELSRADADARANVEVVAVLASAEAPSVFLAPPLSDSMRVRRTSRLEVHEEVTPPAVDPAELTPPGMPAIRMQGSGPTPKLVDPSEPTRPNTEDDS